jgi:phage terminase large subunit-like protein
MNKREQVVLRNHASIQQDVQLIQELIHDGVHGVSRYEPTMDKIMRLHNVSSTIENGFVHLRRRRSGCLNTCMN